LLLEKDFEEMSKSSLIILLENNTKEDTNEIKKPDLKYGDVVVVGVGVLDLL
jgi:hypothetical protein